MISRSAGHAAANPAWSARRSTSSGLSHVTASVSKLADTPNSPGTSTTNVVYDQSSAGANTTDPQTVMSGGIAPTSSEASRRAPSNGSSPSSSAPPAHDQVPPSCAIAERF